MIKEYTLHFMLLAQLILLMIQYELNVIDIIFEVHMAII